MENGFRKYVGTLLTFSFFVSTPAVGQLYLLGVSGQRRAAGPRKAPEKLVAVATGRGVQRHGAACRQREQRAGKQQEGLRESLEAVASALFSFRFFIERLLPVALHRPQLLRCFAVRSLQQLPCLPRQAVLRALFFPNRASFAAQRAVCFVTDCGQTAARLTYFSSGPVVRAALCRANNWLSRNCEKQDCPKLCLPCPVENRSLVARTSQLLISAVIPAATTAVIFNVRSDFRNRRRTDLTPTRERIIAVRVQQ